MATHLKLARRVAVGAAFILPLLANVEPAAAHHGFHPTYEPADCWFDSLAADDFTCGYVTVPVRHAEPDGPTLKLPVAVLPATGVYSEAPLFIAQGGPGGDVFEVFADIASFSPLGATRDLVLFNQRGTRYAQPELTCPELADAAGDVAALDDEAAASAELELLAQCRARLVDSGVDLSAFNSLESAADVEAIREALSYDAFNFYGVSYGSLLGLHLMRRHDDNLRTVVLDAVVPPHLDWQAHVPANAVSLFDRLAAACDADPACANAYPELRARLLDLVDRLDAEPVHISLDDPETGEHVRMRVDGDVLLDTLYSVSYLDGAPTFFPRLVHDAERGDFTFLELVLPLFALDRSHADGMYMSVVCTEDAAPGAPHEGAPASGRVAQAFAANTEEMDRACAVWDVDPGPEILHEPVVSDVPALLLSGAFDPVTPPSFARAAAAGLSRSVQVVHPAGSHGVAFTSPCMSRVVDAFLADPMARPRAECLAVEASSGVVAPSAVVVPWLLELGMLSDELWLGAAFAWSPFLLIMSSLLVWGAAFVVRAARGADTDPTPGSRLFRWAGRLIIIGYGALAVAFAAGMVVLLAHSFATPLISYFAVSGAGLPVLIIPPFLAVLAAAALAVSALAWWEGEWPLWERAYYTVLAFSAVAFAAVLAAQGFMTVLL